MIDLEFLKKQVLVVIGALIIGVVLFFSIRTFFHSNSVSPSGDPPFFGEVKTVVDSKFLISGPMGDRAVTTSYKTRYENGTSENIRVGTYVLIVGAYNAGVQKADKVIIYPGKNSL